MPCYITQTGSYLPGAPVPNSDIERYLGRLDGEQEVRATILKMNGIVSRHYAQDEHQQPTSDVYEMACKAAQECVRSREDVPSCVSMIAAGTTYAPLSGPGIASIVHDRLSQRSLVSQAVEVSSHAGICTSAAAALVTACRAVEAGEHAAALCIGSEFASNVLKSSVIAPIDDRNSKTELRRTQWFMSVFLRFMLSDGAGAFLLEQNPKPSGVSLKVDWTESRSYAHETPLCMSLQNQGERLSQDIQVLNRHLMPSARKFTAHVLERHRECLDDYQVVLPHLSSFFFRKRMERMMRDFSKERDAVPYWTNLSTAGNTGAASIYVMLDEYLREHSVNPGDRILLFIPESGQFNFVMVSLTAVFS